MPKDEVEFRLVQDQTVIVKNREMFRIGDFVNNGSFGKKLKNGKFDHLNDFLYSELHIILKIRNVKIC